MISAQIFNNLIVVCFSLKTNLFYNYFFMYNFLLYIFQLYRCISIITNVYISSYIFHRSIIFLLKFLMNIIKMKTINFLIIKNYLLKLFLHIIFTITEIALGTQIFLVSPPKRSSICLQDI